MVSGPPLSRSNRQLHAGEQNLRVDEAGAEIEHGPAAPPRDPARQRIAKTPALEAWIGDQPVAPTAQPIA